MQLCQEGGRKEQVICHEAMPVHDAELGCLEMLMGTLVQIHCRLCLLPALRCAGASRE